MPGPSPAAVARAAGGWIREGKRALGYYRLRTRLLRPVFERSLRPTDVFLVGHPKSGNTWLAYMLALLREPPARSQVNLATVGRFVPCVHGRDDRIARFDRLPNPRVFRNEYPRHPELYPRTIYLIRDPRAVLPSFWEMHRTMFGDSGPSLAEFVEQYLARRGIFRHWNSELIRWDRQVGQALSAAERTGRILPIRYEDLSSDRPGQLSRIARFAGIEASADDLGRAADAGDFTAMRELEDQHGAEAYLGRAKGTGRFIRRGEVDGWREELPAALARRITDQFGEVMSRAGYGVD